MGLGLAVDHRACSRSSIAAAVGFAYAESHSPEPMVDFRFFRSKSFLGANLVAFIVSFAMLAMFFFLALYMQNIKGYSPLEAGVRFLPSTAVIILVGPDRRAPDRPHRPASRS